MHNALSVVSKTLFEWENPAVFMFMPDDLLDHRTLGLPAATGDVGDGKSLDEIPQSKSVKGRRNSNSELHSAARKEIQKALKRVDTLQHSSTPADKSPQGNWTSVLGDCARFFGTTQNAELVRSLARSLIGWIDGRVVPHLDTYLELCETLGIGLDDLFWPVRLESAKPADLILPSLRKTVLERLSAAGCNNFDCTDAVRSFLRDHKVSNDAAEFLAKRIVVWTKLEFSIPTLFEVKLLAESLHVTIEELIGAPTVQKMTTPDTAKDATINRDWLRRFLEYSRLLHCYVVFDSASNVKRWKSRSDSEWERKINELGEEDNTSNRERHHCEAATKWIKTVNVFAASPGLAEDHGRPRDEVAKLSVYEMLGERLQWIGDCGSEFEPVMRMAEHQAFLAVYDGLCEKSASHSYIPAMHFKKDSTRQEETLRVSFDRIPGITADEIGWIVYYSWRPRMSTEERDAIIQSGREFESKMDETSSAKL